MTIRSLLTVMLLTTTTISSAHRGGMDSNGGHNNRKTGEYHCHRDNCIERNGAKKITAQSGYKSGKYERKSWPHWTDEDRDCQNTRAEMLIRDSLAPVKFKRNKGCSVSHGKWLAPYTGETYTKASKLDIDHIVPLYHAHQTGGANWSRTEKRAFANDPKNLLVTSAKANRSKGAKSPARWKPPLKSYWCSYAEKWRYVKQKYRLKISVPEAQSLGVMEKRC